MARQSESGAGRRGSAIRTLLSLVGSSLSFGRTVSVLRRSSYRVVHVLGFRANSPKRNVLLLVVYLVVSVYVAGVVVSIL